MRTRAALLVVSLVATGAAFADARELVVQVSAAPAWMRLADPIAGQQGSSPFGAGVSLSAYYGFTHALHLGLSVRGGGALDVPFEDVVLPLADGSRPSGAVYANALAAGGDLFGQWRFDTGLDWAPYVRLELGGTWFRYSAVEHYPTGTTLRLPQEDVTEIIPSGRVLAGIEYRLWDRFVLSAAVAFRVNLSVHAAWQVEVPLTVGYAFW